MKKNEGNRLLGRSQADLGVAQNAPSGSPLPSSLRPGHVTPLPPRLLFWRDLGESVDTHLPLNHVQKRRVLNTSLSAKGVS